jgi:hypothetical protein
MAGSRGAKSGPEMALWSRFSASVGGTLRTLCVRWRRGPSERRQERRPATTREPSFLTPASMVCAASVQNGLAW